MKRIMKENQVKKIEIKIYALHYITSQNPEGHRDYWSIKLHNHV